MSTAQDVALSIGKEVAYGTAVARSTHAMMRLIENATATYSTVAAPKAAK